MRQEDRWASKGNQDQPSAFNRPLVNLGPSGDALITVMKATDLRDRNDAPASWGLHLASMGTVIVEGLMRAGGVVVREVPAQQTAEVPFVDHDDVVEAFPTNRANYALGEGILPGRPRRDKDLAYPQAFHPPYESVAVDGVPISEQVLRRPPPPLRASRLTQPQSTL